MDKPRVRFAPSPTGKLHIGGVRTALFNYFFARSMGGEFIIRIEDTDENRYDPSAEKFIYDSLDYLDIKEDESPRRGGRCGNYRQSARDMYGNYAHFLVENGWAYYAFDTDKDLEQARQRWKNINHKGGYNHLTREQMINSLTLPDDKVKEKIDNEEPYVIRFKSNKIEVRVNDGVRGNIMVRGSEVDDKVLLKSNGRPTYHLANVIDDYLMGITHVIRGEEWLPSLPLHVMLYNAFNWEKPYFYHLPLILSPNGGKLSKRNGIKENLPIFVFSCIEQHPDTGQDVEVKGYKDLGFEPEAVINFLMLLGWSPDHFPRKGSEVLYPDEILNNFSLEKINKSGAKYDMEKAETLNAYHVRRFSNEKCEDIIGYDIDKHFPGYSHEIIQLAKERAVFAYQLKDTANQFFNTPESYVNIHKWDENCQNVFNTFLQRIDIITWQRNEIKNLIYNICTEKELKMGKTMPGLRVAITGGLSGCDLVTMMEIIGKEETSERIRKLL